MADDKKINIAVILSAYDKVSAVVNQVVKGTTIQLSQLQKFSENASKKSFAYGRQSLTTGAAIGAPLLAAAKMFGNQEEAALDLRAAMMRDGAKISEQSYNSLIKFAKKSTDVYGQTTASYIEMNRVLLENGLKTPDILNGIGDSVEKLGFVFKMAPAGIGQFAARMKQDMSVLPQQMAGMMDLVSRLQRTGIGKTGEEAVTELSEFYSKAGIGARLLGATGLQSAKDLGALGGVFIRTGLSGNTVGNNFRRIFDGIRDADKIKKANQVASQYGIQLDFFDKNHNFKGIASFAGELGKLQGLDPQKINEILKPFGGHQGLSTDFLESLGKFGVKSFNDYQENLSQLATLDAIAAEKKKGLNFQMTRLINQSINAAVAIGSTYGSSIKRAIMWLGGLVKTVISFVDKHKTLVGAIAKGLLYFAGYKLAIGGAAMVYGSLMGTIANSIKFLGIAGNLFMFLGRSALIVGANMGRLFLLFLTRGIPAMVSFTAQVWANAAAWLANPATYIILAIIAAVAALIAIGILVYKNWDKIMTWFSDQWKSLKAQVAGIIAVFGLFLDVIIGVDKAMLGLFTFNPSLLVNGIKQTALAVSKIASGGISAVYNTAHDQSLAASNAKPTVEHHYFQPVIHLHGTATHDDAKRVTDATKSQFDRWMKDHEAKKKKLSYR